jgi:hypothetical protein
MEIHISVALPAPGRTSQFLESVCKCHFRPHTALSCRKGCGCGWRHTILGCSTVFTVCKKYQPNYYHIRRYDASMYDFDYAELGHPCSIQDTCFAKSGHLDTVLAHLVTSHSGHHFTTMQTRGFRTLHSKIKTLHIQDTSHSGHFTFRTL